MVGPSTKQLTWFNNNGRSLVIFYCSPSLVV
uniref:Uncharacterized protein n=1 Tax=Trichinella nativa TaxID=6335 RepID=A0A0V1KI59_9BILA